MQIYKDSGKTTVILDASALKKSSCLLRTFYVTCKGYKSNKQLNNDTHFGSSFHLFRAEYRTHGSEEVAIKKAVELYESTPLNIKPNKQYLTRQFLIRVCMEYATKYSYGEDWLTPLKDFNGDTLIEPRTKFAIPFRCEDDIDILVAGTQDEVGYSNNNIYWDSGHKPLIVDAKSTSYWNQYNFFDSYFFNPQLLLYRWVIQKYGEMHPNTIWEWIIKQPSIGCMIDAVFYTQPTKDASPKVEIKRSKPIVFKAWQLEEFEIMLNKFVDELVIHLREYLKTGKLPPRYGILTDSCTNQYGKCDFAGACSAIDDEQRESYLELNFIEKEYNPLTFGGI